MTDGGDDRGAGRGRRPHETLVTEGEQVLDGASAAGDDDDVDGVIAVQVPDRGRHLAHGLRALNCDLADGERQPGPAQPGIDQDVVLGLGAATAHEADLPREEGQGVLALRGEQALGRQYSAQLFDARQQVADADRPDVVGAQLQAAALGPETGLGVDDDARALGHLRSRGRLQGRQVAGEDRYRHRHVGVGVAQREVLHARAGAAVELDHLPLDPHMGHSRHVVVDLGRQQTQWPGVVRGGVPGQPGERSPGG